MGIQGMAVADGSPPCKGTPPVPSSIDKNSVKNCPKFSGAVCSTAKCNTKLLKSPKMHGQIACIKGKWQVSAPGKVAKCTGKPVRVIAKCENVATKGLQTITTSVNAQQKVLNAFSDGCSCANKGQAAVRTARTNHHNSVVRHKAAVRAHSAAASASVAIPSQILHKIKPGKCGFAFSSSAYRNAHNRHRNALNHRNTRHRQMTGYKTKYDNAVRALPKPCANASALRATSTGWPGRLPLRTTSKTNTPGPRASISFACTVEASSFTATETPLASAATRSAPR